MKRASGFVLVALWVAFACALQVTLLAFGPWVDFGGASVTRALVPDLGTCVLVAAVARVGRRDAVGLAIAATIGRAAFTGASPFAVLAGSIAVAYLAGTLGRIAELDRPLLRVTSAGVGALIFGSWPSSSTSCASTRPARAAPSCSARSVSISSGLRSSRP